jgi:sec-independent protein translocase protein TatA
VIASRCAWAIRESCAAAVALALAWSRMGIESPVHLIFIAAVALIVLGPKRLPRLARALGQGIREFRGAIEQGGSPPAEPVAPPAESIAPPAEHATPSSEAAVPAPAQPIEAAAAASTGDEFVDRPQVEPPRGDTI